MLLSMYVSLMPCIFTGILNMLFCKLPFFKSLKKPIDCGKKFNDGKRIIGDNKTWKGFLGYVIFGILCTIIWGLICGSNGYLYEHNYFYVNYENTLFYNFIIGLLLGLAYALFELPNSFIKRRLGIIEGKTTTGLKKIFFIFLDQADSIFGCVLVLCLVYKMSIVFYFGYVLLGAFTHLVLNILLYLIHLRKNMF
jgi:CDP-diglyceride synthetase